MLTPVLQVHIPVSEAVDGTLWQEAPWYPSLHL